MLEVWGVRYHDASSAYRPQHCELIRVARAIHPILERRSQHSFELYDVAMLETDTR